MSHGSKKKSSSSDVRNALCVVGWFLLVGLALAFLLLQHQNRKVILHAFQSPFHHGGSVWKTGARFHHFYFGAPRFVTVVMPSVVNPAGRLERLKSITDTWGPLARAIYVVHNVTEYPESEESYYTEDATPTDPYTYPQLLLVPPDIAPEQGVPRLNHVIQEIFEKIDPDFVFFVNDHTFVIPEHVCHYLAKRNSFDDMYVGHALKHEHGLFNSGAAGYILSRRTMSRLVQAWEEEDPTCLVKNGDKWLQGNPGIVTALCLQNVLQVKAEDTRHRGRWHRFHAFPLTRTVSGKVDQWYINKHQDLMEIEGFGESYATLLSGADCCSSETMSFHYVEHLESRALFRTREALLENPHMTDHDLKAFMLREWPKEPKDIGGYSRGLPSEGNHKEWTALLSVVRRISNRRTQMDC